MGPAGDVPPTAVKAIDYSCFGDPHRLVLRQLVEALKLAARAKEKEDAARPGAAAAAERQLVCFDIGAGSGAATEYLAARLCAPPSAGLWEVYGVDLWELGAGYYPASLREFGHDALAAHFEGAAATAAGPPLPGYTQFSANFSGEENVTAARYPADFFIQRIQHFGVVPALVYIDADTHGDRMSRLLALMFDPPGGWGAGCPGRPWP